MNYHCHRREKKRKGQLGELHTYGVDMMGGGCRFLGKEGRIEFGASISKFCRPLGNLVQAVEAQDEGFQYIPTITLIEVVQKLQVRCSLQLSLSAAVWVSGFKAPRRFY